MLAWFRECPRAVCNAYPVAMLVYARRLFTFNMRAECTATLDGLLQSLNTNTTLSEAEKNNLLGEVEIVKSFLDFNNIKAMSAHHRRACVLMDRPDYRGFAHSGMGLWFAQRAYILLPSAGYTG